MLFQTMVIWKDRPVQMQFIELEGLTPFYVHAHSGAAKYDLTLFLTESGDEIGLEVEYCTDLFDEATIRRMVGHYQRLLEAMVADPSQPTSQIPMLTDDERQQILVEWNDTEMAYPRDRCLHQLFEEQVERTPEAVALVFENQQLTYKELNARSDRLAGILRNLGVGPEVLVGICVDRSLQMVVGLLGVLKAGGAYLPLDPSFPADRLGYMVDQSRPKVVLTQRSLADVLPAHKAAVIFIDDPIENTGKAPALGRRELSGGPETLRRPGPDDLAYVIYTSGSTGRPKGVQISHGAVVNLLTSMRREPGLAAEDRLLAVTTLSFDIAALELFLPLTSGACVIIAPRDVAANGWKLARLLEDSHATVMQATPATWRMLLEARLGRQS